MQIPAFTRKEVGANLRSKVSGPEFGGRGFRYLRCAASGATSTCSRAMSIAILGMLVLSLISPSVVHADYVGSQTLRIFLDPASSAVVSDGYQAGDVVSWILETAPRDTGSTFGDAAYMSLYVPPGVEVVGAEFVNPSSGGNYITRPAKDTGKAYFDCGSRNCQAWTPATGTIHLANGAIDQVQSDTGIFYSTDPRTALVVAGVGSLDPTGGPPTQVIYNQWDYDQLSAFGVSGALSGNGGTGNTPLVTTNNGATWAGTGSGVAGPNTFYTNDYNPNCSTSNTPTAFVNDVTCVGPWQRIAYPNSKLADSGPLTPSTTNNAGAGNTSVLTAAGFSLSTGNPLPAGTNVVRWVHGARVLGDLEYGRVTLRITNPAAFVASFSNDTFCLESTGSDTSDVAAKDNIWRYYEPEHKCFDTLNGSTGAALLTKSEFTVNGCSSSLQYLHQNDVISFHITFENTSGQTLTNVQLSDQEVTGRLCRP